MVLEMTKKKDIIHNMKTYGFHIIENYWSADKCVEALNELCNLPVVLFERGQGNDSRCQFANKYCDTAMDFFKDEFIQEIANKYSKCNVADRVVGGIVDFNPRQKTDSGGGWHVDSKKKSQFKSFMYLSNVGPENGPFVFIQKSKKLVGKFRKYKNLRISENSVNKKINPDDIIEITGKAGTCVLADSTFIHRGKQIQSGSRYTYTTYFEE